METYDFEASIGYWIALAFQRYQQRLNDALAPYGITYRQFQVLAWLVHEGEMSQHQLAERMTIEPPTLVGLLDRMQREGWIERECCTEDRRRKWVRLSKAAEPVWGKVVSCLREARAEATKNMTEDEVATLLQLLCKVHRNLSNTTSMERLTS